MTLDLTLEQALLKASPALREKMKKSIELIKKAEKLSLMYDDVDGFFLAFSGGKDSQALYHITELSGVKYKSNFSPTTVDPPQLIRFIRKNYPETKFGKVEKNIYDMAVEKTILPMTGRWCRHRIHRFFLTYLVLFLMCSATIGIGTKFRTMP